MTREREILQKILMAYRVDKSCMSWGVAEKIEGLLAKPEQEPVAWIIETEVEGKLNRWACMDKKYHRDSCDRGEPIPLYTSPPTREPLGDLQPEQEPDLWVVTNACGINKYLYSKPRKQVYESYRVTAYYKKLPKSKSLIEKAHGIGVGNNGND